MIHFLYFKVFLLCLILNFLAFFSVGAQNSECEAILGEYIIKYKPAVEVARINSIRSSIGAQKIHDYKNLSPNLEFVRIKQTNQPLKIEDILTKYKDIEDIQPNCIIKSPVAERKENLKYPVSKLYTYQTPLLSRLNQTPTVNDPEFDKLWGLNNYGQNNGKNDVDINAPEAWTITKGDPALVVAVLSTGLDIFHKDIASNVWVNPNEIPGNNIDDDGNGCIDDVNGCNVINDSGDVYDDYLYKPGGTHGSGVIAAIGDNNIGIVGVAPNVKIMPVKFFDEEGTTTFDIELKAYEYVLKIRQRGVNIRVIDASYGGRAACKSYIKDAIQKLNDAGILFVSAVGNSFTDNDKKSIAPANCGVPNIVSVTAIVRTGELEEHANYGIKTVDIAAPGDDILSLSIGDDSYADNIFGSTTIAVPFVSGVAALGFSLRPDLTPAQMRSVLMGSAKKLPSLKGKIASGGMVDAYATLKALQGTIPTEPTPTDTPGGDNSLLTFTKVKKLTVKTTGTNLLTFSSALTPESLNCFSLAVSPKSKTDTPSVRLKSKTLLAKLTRKIGKKKSTVAFKKGSTLTLSIKADCAKDSDGRILDSDQNKTDGGAAKKIKFTA